MPRSNSVLCAAVEAGEIARRLDDRDLHAEADAEVGNLVFTGKAYGGDFALDAAVTEAAGHDDCHPCRSGTPMPFFSMSCDSK